MITTTEWTLVGPRCFARRVEPYAVNVCVVVGDDALLVVDSGPSLAAGRRLLTEIRALSGLDVRAVVNTHQHFDHTFGNAAFGDAPVVGHESLPEALTSHAERVRAEVAAQADADERLTEIVDTPLRLPDTTFESVWAVNLGDCYVEIVHPGRGHTCSDVVVNIPSSGVLIAGDIVEQSGPPSYGDDSFPLQWPAQLDMAIELTPSDAVVVPGHGNPVDRDFMESQRQQIVGIAEQVNQLALSGVSAADAYEQGEWPYDRETMEPALARAFEQWTPPRQPPRDTWTGAH